MRVWWGPEADDAAEFTSIDLVMARVHALDRAHRERPVLLDVVGSDGAILSIGVGGALSVAMHTHAGLEPPYLTSRAAEPLSETTAWFDHGGAETEFRREALIERSAAWALLRRFLADGDISGIGWDEE